MNWINVKDQLPPSDWVLLYAEAKEDCVSMPPFIFVGRLGGYDSDDYCCAHGDGWIPFEDEDITHWMPLPQPPQ